MNLNDNIAIYLSFASFYFLNEAPLDYLTEAVHSGPLGFTHLSTIYSLSPLDKKTFFQQEISGLLTNWSLDQLRLEMQKEVSIIAANDSFQYH